MEKKLVFGFVLLSLLFGFIYIGNGHEWGDDFALYISQAQAIIQNKTQHLFTYNQWSMDQSQATMGPYLYPPGYPLLLTFYLKWLPFNWFGLKIFQWVIYCLSILLFYTFLKEIEWLNKGWIFFALAVYAFHPKILEFSNRLMSDLWFTLLVYVFFYFLYKKEKNWKNELMVGLTLFLCVITRVNGILLLGSWIISAVVNYKKNIRYSFQGFILFVFVALCWFYSSYSAKYESNHIHILDQLNLTVIGDNFLTYLGNTGGILLWHPMNIINKIFLNAEINIFGIFMGAMILMALGIAIKRKWIHNEWFALLFFIVANLGVLIVWPFVQGTRYLVPLIPAVGILIAYLLQEFTKSVSPKIKKSVIIICICMIGFQGFATALYGRFVLHGDNQVWNALECKMYAEIQKKTGNSDVIAFDKPRWLHLATERKCIQASDLQFLLKSPATLLLVSEKGIYGNSRTIKDSTHLVRIKTWEDSGKGYILYRIIR